MVGLGGWTSNYQRWPDISVSDPSVCLDLSPLVCQHSDSAVIRLGIAMFASLDTYDMAIDADMAPREPPKQTAC